MKAFKKWYGPDIPDITIDALEWIRYNETKRAWKAALKWALTQETDIQSTELGWAIIKELEGE